MLKRRRRTEIGLNCNYFHDYEPGTSRYVESDPVGRNAGQPSACDLCGEYGI